MVRKKFKCSNLLWVAVMSTQHLLSHAFVPTYKGRRKNKQSSCSPAFSTIHCRSTVYLLIFQARIICRSQSALISTKVRLPFDLNLTVHFHKSWLKRVLSSQYCAEFILPIENIIQIVRHWSYFYQANFPPFHD